MYRYKKTACYNRLANKQCVIILRLQLRRLPTVPLNSLKFPRISTKLIIIMNTSLAFLLFALVFFVLEDAGVEGVPIEVDLKVTNEQKAILNKFKKIMKPKLPHKYMQEDIYLIRWLRARNFDMKKAEDFLLANLRWRKKNNMDTIHSENFDDIKDQFPYSIGEIFDKTGRPVVTAKAVQWDIRKAVITGQVKRALRYLDKAMDEATHMIRRMQLEGRNVTQFVIILHMGSFNLVQHGCPKCITSILKFIDSYENHFPGMADRIFLVQTPPAFESIAQIVRKASSPQTREAMKVYGFEPKVWKKALLDIIDAKQLPKEFGGTRGD